MQYFLSFLKIGGGSWSMGSATGKAKDGSLIFRGEASFTGWPQGSLEQEVVKSSDFQLKDSPFNF